MDSRAVHLFSKFRSKEKKHIELNFKQDFKMKSIYAKQNKAGKK